MQRPTKAIIAAAGFGTRFLPQTKAMPKEMMPIIDKPIIQYVVEELVEAGIKDIILVGSSTKRSIEDHFDLPNEDLVNNLRAGGEKKKPLLETVEGIANLANFVFHIIISAKMLHEYLAFETIANSDNFCWFDAGVVFHYNFSRIIFCAIAGLAWPCERFIT